MKLSLSDGFSPLGVALSCSAGHFTSRQSLRHDQSLVLLRATSLMGLKALETGFLWREANDNR